MFKRAFKQRKGNEHQFVSHRFEFPFPVLRLRRIMDSQSKREITFLDVCTRAYVTIVNRSVDKLHRENGETAEGDSRSDSRNRVFLKLASIIKNDRRVSR